MSDSELERAPSFGAAMLAAAVLSAAGLATLPSCLEQREQERASTIDERCTACHGDVKRSGDYLLRAAPPRDVTGATEPGYPGVGAHSIHLAASSTHAAIACTECHEIPERSDSPGHADGSRPARLVFGPLARTGDRDPSYDGKTRRCSDSYCHREADAVWTSPRSSAEACGSCHALPPPPPHPSSDRCSACHGDVVDDQRNIIQPDLHVNGTVEYTPGPCTTCHGMGDNPAPPLDTHGNEATSSPGVGAHAAHLSGGGGRSRPVACQDCHVVPKAVGDEGHVDPPPAEVVLTGIASEGDRHPTWSHDALRCSDTHCHAPDAPGGESPLWTSTGPLACDSCHGAPPPPPHPASSECFACHAQVVDEKGEIIRPDLHVNGTVEYSAGGCTTCHGKGDNPAPPVDTHGNESTSAPGVGAHAAHLAGGENSRPVACKECHVVPKAENEPGHVDGPPAEVVFAGVATKGDHSPTWDHAKLTCSDTHCHGPSTPESKSPLWTSQGPLGCTSCHGAPPPAPHPASGVCFACHADVIDAQGRIIDRSRHVNGVVDLHVTKDCSTCHGSSTNAAPPKDLLGRSSSPAVGAHQAHLIPNGRTRPVPCAECHLVPDQVLASGHVDSALPAELTFSGVAVAFGASPEYSGGSCKNTLCHGAVFPDGHTSGGTNTEPRWSGGSGEVACGSSCHTLPPPWPHPYQGQPSDCHTCHEDLAADNVSFVRPDLHVDGITTFKVDGTN